MASQKHTFLDFPSAVPARSLQSLYVHSGRVKQQPHRDDIPIRSTGKAGKGYAAGETSQ